MAPTHLINHQTPNIHILIFSSLSVFLNLPNQLGTQLLDPLQASMTRKRLTPRTPTSAYQERQAESADVYTALLDFPCAGLTILFAGWMRTDGELKAVDVARTQCEVGRRDWACPGCWKGWRGEIEIFGWFLGLLGGFRTDLDGTFSGFCGGGLSGWRC